MQNPREKRGSKWSNPVHFERILVRIVRVWAHLSSFSSNSCSKAVQNDHISPRWSCATIEAFPASLFTPAGNNDGTGLRDGPVGVPHSICQDLGMSAAAMRGMVRRLGPSADPPLDADLVTAFAARRDADAFAALVDRHGPTVLGVCRRLLGDAHAAEDAFQVVFLVLAQKVKAVRPPGAVGGWLYGVAVRTANKVRVATARRRRREMIAAFNSASRSASDRRFLQSTRNCKASSMPNWRGFRKRFCAAIVLCDLQGKTRAEAATELKCPEGTVAAVASRTEEAGRCAVASGAGATGHRARRRPDARRRFRRRESLGCRQCLRLRLSRDPGTGS